MSSTSPLTEPTTSSDIDAVIRRAELECGRGVGRRELLMATMFRVAVAFIRLETIRPKMVNSKINLAFRKDQYNTLEPKAEITLPTE